eukprot:10110035-Karenia_brevis.AAC.3
MVLECFQDGDVPPDLPTDCFFDLAATTGYVISNTPHEIGDRMVKFLREAVDSTIVKVNRCKFAIKANVSVEGLTFTMKIRIYKLRAAGFAVEFQRRSGDTIGFHRAFE